MTRAEFARLAGMSRSAIHQAETSGRLYLQRERLDPAHPMNAAYLERAKQRRLQKALAGIMAAGTETGPEAPTANVAELVLKKLEHDVTYRWEQILTHRLKRLQALGHLIDRQIVEQALARFNGELEIRLLDLPRRIGPRLAALAKTGEDAQVVTVLEDELAAALRDCKKAAVV